MKYFDVIKTSQVLHIWR